MLPSLTNFCTPAKTFVLIFHSAPIEATGLGKGGFYSC